MIFKRNIFAYLSASVIERGLGLIATTFAMRRTTAEVFGIFSHLRMLPPSVIPFASLGLDNVVARVYSRSEKSPFLFAVFAIWLVSGIVICTATVPIARVYFGEAFYRRIGEPDALLRLLVFSSFLIAMSISSFVVMEKARRAAGLTASVAAVGCAATIAFGITHSIPLALRILAFGTTGLLGILLLAHLGDARVGLLTIVAKLRQDPAGFFPVLLSDLRFALPFALASWIAILASRAGAMVFSNEQNGTGLAFANLALNVAALVQIFGWALNNSENPKVLNGLLAAGNPTREQLDQAFSRLVRASHIAVMGCSFTVFFSIVYVLFSTSRWSTNPRLIYYIVFFSLLKFLFDVVGTFLQYDFLYLEKKLGYATLVKTILLLLQIPLLTYLVSRFGLSGALAGYLVTSFLNLLPGEFFLGRTMLRRRLIVYGHHLMAFSPFTVLFLAQTKTSLICLAALSAFASCVIDYALAPQDFRTEILRKLRLRT